MDTTNLISWLTFDVDATTDLCGNTWTAYGNPTIGTDGAISGSALQLDGSGYLRYGSTFNFTGQPFTIGCWFSGVSNTTGGDVCLWQMYIANRNRIQLEIATSGKMDLWKDSDNTIYIRTAASVLDGQIHHAECDFDGSTWYLFLDGVLVGTKAHTCTARNYSLYIGLNYQTDRKFTGTIDEFQIYDGVALHTENFTPPTAEDYFEQRLALTGSANISLTFDVARIVRNYPKLLEGLAVWLPFDDSPTEDLCGNTWAAYGSPTIGTNGAISVNALQLNGSSYLQKSGSISLGGQDFTIRGWFNTGSTGNWSRVFSLHNAANSNATLNLMRKEKGNQFACQCLANTTPYFTATLNSRHHFELDYSYATSTAKIFIDGSLKASCSATIPRTVFANLLIGRGNFTADDNWTGSIDEFQIYDGVALHTENFTPPTADDYFGLKRALNSPLSLTLTFDVARHLSNRVEFSVDVARIITNSRFIVVKQSLDVARKIVKSVNFSVDVVRIVQKTWRYVNAGDADDLIVPSTIIRSFSKYITRTGVVFYQTAREKCFDLPATPEIWIKFDVYFDGSNRWRAYNGGNNDFTGITAQTDNEITYFVNGNEVHAATNAAKKNQLQTVLLHMISGSSDGIVEAWVDGDFIYRYTGDVNHGADFADIYLQSDGAGTYFSNVIISNAQIGLNDGYKSFTADVVRRVKNRVTFTADVARTIISVINVPFIFGEHFNHCIREIQAVRKPQKFQLPKRGKVYVHADTLNGDAVKIYSDADATGTVTGDVYAAFDDCESIFVQATLSPQLILYEFMYGLYRQDLDGAINWCTGGLFTSKDEVVNSFFSDLDSSESNVDFLLRCCGIVFGNADTGAITGSDAGGGYPKTAESIVPETIFTSKWVVPESGSSKTIDGLTVHFPATGVNGAFSDAEKHILAGLNSVWIEQALRLIKKSIRWSFSGYLVNLRDISVQFVNNQNNALAYVSITTDNTSYVTALTLNVNMHTYRAISMVSEDGALNKSNELYLDRTLAHELTHAIMAVFIIGYVNLPLFIKEGSAELIHGIDDTRESDIRYLTSPAQRSTLQSIFDTGGESGDIYVYSAGYLFFRYMIKQTIERESTPLRRFTYVYNLVISDGEIDYSGEALTDNTRQIFSADVARTLIKSLGLIVDVVIRDAIRVSFAVDVARAVLAHLVLFPIDTNRRLFSKAPTLKAANRNTQGLQSFEVSISEQQITEQVKFAGVLPFDILQKVTGQYLDYHFDMRVEKVQQEGIIYRCECCSDLDQLLFTQLAYTIPPTTWRKVGADDKTVEIQTYYPPATAHVQKIASALGLTPVMQFDNFLSTVLMDDLGGVTYNDLIRDVFGWSSRVPHMLINCYIRNGKLFVIQRGHEANTIDISNAKCTMPVITKELIRTTWGSTPWSKTQTTEFQHSTWQAGVPDDMTISGGSDTGGGGSGGSTIPSGDDDEEEKVREVSTRFEGLNYHGHTTYTYDRKGLLIQTYTYVAKDINGRLQETHTTVKHDYDDDNTMIYTSTFVQSFGAEGDSSSKSIEEKGYVILPNGEKFLAWEHSATYQNDESISLSDNDLVDSKVTVHSPSRVGQSHTITIGTDGEIIGSAAGQNTGDDRVTPFSRYKAAALGKNLFARTSSSISGGSSGGSGGEWTTDKETWELTTNGLSLYDSSFPIHDEATLIKVTNALKWLNRKTQETLIISVYEFPHLIDFNDRVVFNGKTYFLVNNTAATTPRIFNEQNLTLARWY